MLSKSAARSFFLIGTLLCSGAFILLTIDTIRQVPSRTHEENLTLAVKRGKKVWERNNCMGCHTILGEGAYYAPELTQVYIRRGSAFIKSMLKDPEAMYPGQRRMQKYDLTDEEIEELVAFLKWIGEIDTNGFPAKPSLNQIAVPAVDVSQTVALATNRPNIFNQMCIACHSLQGQGGSVGPALDGVGSRHNKEYLSTWLKNPSAIKPGTAMPQLPLSEVDLSELIAFLSELKESQAEKKDQMR